MGPTLMFVRGCRKRKIWSILYPDCRMTVTARVMMFAVKPQITNKLFGWSALPLVLFGLLMFGAMTFG
jgi:hypothetical protein